MKAVTIAEPGPVENLVYGDVEEPTPRGAQVLVEVGAVAVNPIDTYIRSGVVPMELPKPFIVGCDVAGRVLALGPDARRFRVGDRVWGSNQGLLGRQGTFAEKVTVDEAWLYPTPEDVTDEEAAASALVGITAHLGLFRFGGLREGETVFVNGGAGGVGSTVVQMASAFGARVLASAGSDERVAACRSLGADEAFNYRTADLRDAVHGVCPAGVALWWETGREPDFDLAVACLARRGRMILMAGRDARPAFPVGPFYVKECTLRGFVMFMASPDEQRACADDINRWLSTGELKPRIDRVLPLSEAAEAHRLQEENTIGGAGTLSGKIVLKP